MLISKEFISLKIKEKITTNTKSEQTTGTRADGTTYNISKLVEKNAKGKDVTTLDIRQKNEKGELIKNAEDYWNKCSSNQFIPEIKIPTLIVNARNDPFIAGGCYPIKETSNSKHVYLEIPKSGGHVGFIQFKKDRSYWSEERTIEFLEHN